MASVFDQIIGNAQRAIAASAGVSVKYSRGTDWVRLIAVPGRTDFESVDTSGVVTQFRARDYLIAADDLVISDQPTEPRRGDTITEQIGNQLYLYEVSQPAGSGQPWRYSDNGHQTVRIHTKLKAVTPA